MQASAPLQPPRRLPLPGFLVAPRLAWLEPEAPLPSWAQSQYLVPDRDSAGRAWVLGGPGPVCPDLGSGLHRLLRDRHSMVRRRRPQLRTARSRLRYRIQALSCRGLLGARAVLESWRRT